MENGLPVKLAQPRLKTKETKTEEYTIKRTVIIVWETRDCKLLRYKKRRLKKKSTCNKQNK